MQSPAEILFEVCQKGKNETTGRGLLEDGDIRLRIERHHNILRAYAGNVDGPWYLAGETDFPGGEVTIGFHGEAIVDTYSITNRCIVRFRDIRFEGYPVE